MGCVNCKKMHHFASVCRSDNSKKQHRPRSKNNATKHRSDHYRRFYTNLTWTKHKKQYDSYRIKLIDLEQQIQHLKHQIELLSINPKIKVNSATTISTTTTDVQQQQLLQQRSDA